MGPRDLDSHLISISRIRAHRGSEISMLALRGTVRPLTSDDFRARLGEAGRRSPYLVVDLSELEYINSAGLGMLLHQARIQEGRRGWLRLVAPTNGVAMILRLSGVADQLPLFTDEEDALGDVSGRAA